MTKHHLLLKCMEVMQLVEKCGASTELTNVSNCLLELAKDIEKEVVPQNGEYYSKHVKEAIGIVVGEPIFVLKGRDPIAPDLIYKWANIRQAIHSGTETQKIIDARDLAAHFGLWKNHNPDIGLKKQFYEMYCRAEYLRKF